MPPIGSKDVAAGLLSLVNRRLLPPSVDLTPALERHPAPMKQAPARMHDFKAQFAPHQSAAYLSPFGFNVSNTKLDVLSDVGTTLAEKVVPRLEPSPADAVATLACTTLPPLPRRISPDPRFEPRFCSRVSPLDSARRRDGRRLPRARQGHQGAVPHHALGQRPPDVTLRSDSNQAPTHAPSSLVPNPNPNLNPNPNHNPNPN